MRFLAFASVVLVACGTVPPTGTGGGGAGGGGTGGGDAGADAGSGGGAGGQGGGSSGGAGGAGGSAGTDAGVDAGIVDLDHDGLDDAWEMQVAQAYLPTLAKHPQDACPLSGIAFRVRPHPQNPALLNIIYDHLFQDDCGATSHVGDNECFAITVNPAKPAPQGITAVKAISHQNTPCQKVTECGTCNNLPACAGARPSLYSSKDKHGGYAVLATCNHILSCLDQCADGVAATVPMVNVGEPAAHLIDDLSDGGFITTANGWSKTQLFHYSPWDTAKKFGGAGNVANDFLDPAFVAAACN